MNRPRLSIRLLIGALVLVSILFNGVIMSVGERNFTPERVALIMLAAPVVALSVARGFNLHRGVALSAAAIFAWCFVLLISTMASDDPGAHVNGYVISVLPVVAFLLFAGNGPDNDRIVGFCAPVLLMLSGVSALVIYIGWRGSHSPSLALFIDRDRVRLLNAEPNVFGSTVAFLLILYLPYLRRSARSILPAALGCVALILSFSKGPYLAFAIGAATFGLLSGVFRSGRAKVALFVSGAAVTTLLLAGLQRLGGFYTTFLDRRDSLNARVLNLRFALSRWREHPIIGNGPLDFGQTSQSVLSALGTSVKQNVWIWQMFVSIGHDTGFIGLGVYLAFLMFLLGYGLVEAFRGDTKHASYVAAFVALLCASQTTTLHLNAIFGIAAGLVATRRPQVKMGGRVLRGGPASAAC